MSCLDRDRERERVREREREMDARAHTHTHTSRHLAPGPGIAYHMCIGLCIYTTKYSAMATQRGVQYYFYCGISKRGLRYPACFYFRNSRQVKLSAHDCTSRLSNNTFVSSFSISNLYRAVLYSISLSLPLPLSASFSISLSLSLSRSLSLSLTAISAEEVCRMRGT